MAWSLLSTYIAGTVVYELIKQEQEGKQFLCNIFTVNRGMVALVNLAGNVLYKLIKQEQKSKKFFCHIFTVNGGMVALVNQAGNVSFTNLSNRNRKVSNFL